MSEKIYNALVYSDLEYIHQIHMLSHVKYRNSIFKRIEKYLNIFDSRKISISVLYIREHIQLVYIPQNRVQKGIVYVF